MGWNSWNHFHCGVNDGVIRGAVDAMVSNHFVWFAWILAIVSWLGSPGNDTLWLQLT